MAFNFKDFGQETPVEPTPSFVSGIGDSIKGAFTGGVEQIKSGVQESMGAQDVGSFLEGGLRGAAGVVNTAFSPLAPVGELVAPVVEPVVTAASEALNATVGERAASNIGNAVNVAGAFYAPTAAKGAAKVAAKAPSAAGEAVGKTAKYATSQATGLAPETLAEIWKNPKSFNKDILQNTNRTAVASEVESGLAKMNDYMSDLGDAYQAIRNSGDTVKVGTTIRDVFADFGLKVSDEGKIETSTTAATRNSADIAALQRIVDTWETTKILTADEFLNLRSDIAELANFDRINGKTPVAETIAKSLRAKLNELGHKQVSPLKRVDGEYAPIKETIKELRGLFDKNGELKDGAASKIANAINKPHLLAAMEKIAPGVTQKIKVLSVVEDIERASGLKVGTYTRATVAGAGIAGLNIPLIVAAILSQPEVAVAIIRRLALTTEQIAGVLTAVRESIGAIGQPQRGMINFGELIPERKGAKATPEAKARQDGSLPDNTANQAEVKPTDTSGGFDGGLMEEAKKYKSAEKFVKAQGNKNYYHTTSTDVAPLIEKDGFKAQTGERSMGTNQGNGVFFYEDVSPTVNFGKNFTWKGKEPTVVEAKINGKIYNSKSQSKSINALAEDAGLIEQLKADGFVGVRGTENGTPVTFVFEPSAVKTKSQLTDIWNKANKK